MAGIRHGALPVAVIEAGEADLSAILQAQDGGVVDLVDVPWIRVYDIQLHIHSRSTLDGKCLRNAAKSA